AVACAGRKLGLHFDVHAHQWNLAVFHDSALRAACAHAHNVDTTDTAVLLGQPTRTGCAACVCTRCRRVRREREAWTVILASLPDPLTLLNCIRMSNLVHLISIVAEIQYNHH